MRIVFLAFILFPIIEMMVLIEVGSHIGALSAIALVVLTALIGLSLIRKQGASTLFRAKDKFNQGNLPAKEILETIMLALAGFLLLLPGFVTDIFGFILIVPLFRKGLAAYLLVKVLAKSTNLHAGWRFSDERNNDGEIIEGEFVNEDRDLINKK